jgi:hypothetical protein
MNMDFKEAERMASEVENSTGWTQEGRRLIAQCFLALLKKQSRGDLIEERTIIQAEIESIGERLERRGPSEEGPLTASFLKLRRTRLQQQNLMLEERIDALY